MKDFFIKVRNNDIFEFFVISIILASAVLVGFRTYEESLNPEIFFYISSLDYLITFIFVVEIFIRIVAEKSTIDFFKSGWNVFDFVVVAVALVPNAGALSVLRTLRVLRVLRVLTVVPSLKRVVAAFIHAIPGLGSVVAVMAIFFYAAAVMAVGFFRETHPDWFGSIGKSLYSLFQIMTLESWSMGIVRPVMESHPYAWAFFVPFIILATFTILNLFIGIIVSTMQELSVLPDPDDPNKKTIEILSKIEEEVARLRAQLDKDEKP